MKPQSFVNEGQELGRYDADECPTRSTATDLTCSACAFESRSRPVAEAGSITWNG